MNEEKRGAARPSPAQQTEVAVLAGGCFWGVEEILRAVPGVLDTDVGYTGGWLENPTYHDTHDSKSGHAEAVRITFDPSVLSYEDAARAVVLPAARSDDAQPPGERRRHAVPLGDLPADPRAEGHRRAGDRARERVGQVEAPDHDEHRARGDLVQRGGVPPGLSAEESWGVHVPLHAGLGGRQLPRLSARLLRRAATCLRPAAPRTPLRTRASARGTPMTPERPSAPPPWRPPR